MNKIERYEYYKIQFDVFGKIEDHWVVCPTCFIHNSKELYKENFNEDYILCVCPNCSAEFLCKLEFIPVMITKKI